MNDLDYMKMAYAQAVSAGRAGEIPVGAVVACATGEVLSRAGNRVERGANAMLHAEIEAIRKACRRTGEKYLAGATMYVTLEPCPMCMGAISWAKIARVVYGAADEKGGGAWMISRLLWRPKVEGGVMAGECGALISAFFKKMRARESVKRAP
jgi:tRNA(adenine34) deaminase